MELKVGMYLRCSGADDEYPIIQKITKLESPGRFGWKYKVFTDKCGSWFIDSPDIEIEKAKYSFNIIDLIEVGDYVNGHKVTEILISNNKVYEIQVKRPNNRTGVWIERIRKNEDIKSIVTKEQFKYMEYRI